MTKKERIEELETKVTSLERMVSDLRRFIRMNPEDQASYLRSEANRDAIVAQMAESLLKQESVFGGVVKIRMPKDYKTIAYPSQPPGQENPPKPDWWPL